MNRTEFKRQIGEWSDQEFNDGVFYPFRSIGCAHHLKEEAEELTEALEKYFTYPSAQTYAALLEELADCDMLLLDILRLLEISDDELLEAEQAKLEINKNCIWESVDNSGVINHKKD